PGSPPVSAPNGRGGGTSRRARSPSVASPSTPHGRAVCHGCFSCGGVAAPPGTSLPRTAKMAVARGERSPSVASPSTPHGRNGLDDCLLGGVRGRVEMGPPALFGGLVGGDGGKGVHGPGEGPGPAGLVAGAQAGAVVAVEVLVEQQAVAPVRVLLKLLAAAVHGPPALR